MAGNTSAALIATLRNSALTPMLLSEYRRLMP
jgi:hypothetical protein